MEQSNPKSQELSPIVDRSVECYARKLGVAGESVGEIDEQTLQGLRKRLNNLLLVDEEEGVFELFSVRGRESKAYFPGADLYPYLLRLDTKDPSSPNSPLRVVEVLDRPSHGRRA
jgi:hypothetical protein